jgi:transposase-like protein
MIVLVYQSILVIQMTETNGGASISNVSHADDKAQSSAATTTTVSRSQDRRYSAIEKQFYLDRLVNGGLSLKELAKETGIGRNRLRSWGADLKAGTLVDDPILNTSMHVDVDMINDDDDYISSKIQVKSVDDIIFAPREVYYSDIDGALFDWYQREVCI